MDFSLSPRTSPQQLPLPLSRTASPSHDFPAITKPTEIPDPSTNTPASQHALSKQENKLLRHTILHDQKQTPREDLKKAFETYTKHAATPTEKKTWSAFTRFIAPQPDPLMDQLNHLHTLFSKTLHVCGDTLRQLVSEEDMQRLLESAWQTKKVDPPTLKFYEEIILNIAKHHLEES